MRAPEELLRNIKDQDCNAGDKILYDQEGGLAIRAISSLLAKAAVLQTEPLFLEGGFKAWKAWQQEVYSRPRQWLVLAGLSGAGKTEVLRAMADRGVAVLDWEQCCEHRGSAFGDTHQGSKNKDQLERELLRLLMALPEHSPVIVEQKPALIGRMAIPPSLVQALRHAPCVYLQRSRPQRIRRIVDTYSTLPHDQLEGGFSKLRKCLPEKDAGMLTPLLRRRDYAGFVDKLLPYYDNSLGYAASTGKPLLTLDMDVLTPGEAAFRIEEALAIGSAVVYRRRAKD